MDLQIEDLEEKLKTLLSKLRAEHGIFQRLVYKNKNQHRRSSYFQYLLKVRSDLRLLQSAKLVELVASCFQVITGKKPKQKVQLLESLKRRKCDGGNHNFMERLLGAARLLSQMVEPMLKAATEVSTLLARSFFMGFSVTVLALLARLRILIQQILLDVVTVFNIVSSLSQKKHSVKINHEGIEVYREFYPVNEEHITLECVWQTDKFVLLERSHKTEKKSIGGDGENDLPTRDSVVQYQSLESFLGDDEPDSEKADADRKGHVHITEGNTNLLTGPSNQSDVANRVGSTLNAEEISGKSATPDQKLTPDGGLQHKESSSTSSTLLKANSSTKKVAFVSVKRPAPATWDSLDPGIKEPSKKSDDQEDKFYNLLTGGNLKDSLF